jgi:hypothetical protein
MSAPSWQGSEAKRPASNCSTSAASMLLTLPSQFTSPKSGELNPIGVGPVCCYITAVTNAMTARTTRAALPFMRRV